MPVLLAEERDVIMKVMMMMMMCRFRVRSAPYEAARANANSTSSAGDGLSDFDRRTSFFPVVVVILRALIPCAVIVLLFHAAYLYAR